MANFHPRNLVFYRQILTTLKESDETGLLSIGRGTVGVTVSHVVIMYAVPNYIE